MSKLIVAVLALIAPVPVAVAAASQDAPRAQEVTRAPERAKPADLLAELVQASRLRKLTPESAAAALLAAGPEATAALYARILEAPVAGSSQGFSLERLRVRKTLRAIPSVIVGIATLPTLSAKDRAHALSVTLEVLTGSDPETSIPALTRVLRAAATKPLPESVLARLKRTVTTLSSYPELRSGQVIQWIRAAGPRLSTSVIDGVGQSQAVMTLVGCLRVTTGAEGTILNRVAALIQRGTPVEAETAALAALPFLSSTGAFERKEASAILGFIGNRRHVQALIHGLDDDEHIVRTASLKALKELTGMTISGDPGRWKLWYQDQETWWTTVGSELVASIQSAPRRELVGVLASVSTRRLYRKEIAAQLLQLLHRSRADEVRLAVAGLATLRDPSTLPSILALRDHDNIEVRAAVENAVMAFRHAGIDARRVRSRPAN